MKEHIKNGYLILVDTSFLIEGFDTFYTDTLYRLQKYNEKIIVPGEVINELKKVYKEKKITKEKYREIDYLLNDFKSNNLLAITPISGRNHTDNILLSKITELRLRRDIVLCTNDKGLARDVLNLRNSNSTKYIKDIQIYTNLNMKNKGIKKVKTSKDYLLPKTINRKFTKSPLVKVENKSPYKKDDGSLINGYNEFAKGGEGIIYKSGNELLKVYYRDQIPANIEEKIKALKNLKIDNIMLPQKLVYNIHDQFIGFSMSLVEDSVTLDSYLKGIFLDKYTPKRSDLADICIAITEITKKLHNQNVFVGDWNTKNVLINPDTLEVNLIDVDSFQINNFPCPVGMTGFIDPDFLKISKGSINSHFRTKGNEIFSLNVLLFKILMLDKPPFARKGNTNLENNDYIFPYRFNSSNEKEPEGNWKYIWHNLSFRIKETFSNTFKDNKRYDVIWWNYILRGYKQNIERGLNTDELRPKNLKQ